MPDPVYKTPTVVTTTTPTVSVTPDTVYSADNVAQTLTNPAAKPDLSDPFGTYSFYMNSPEIQAAKAQAQSVMEAINASRQGLRTTTTALQNQNENAQGGTGASINLIGRQVGRARELTSNELSALSENQMAAQSYLDTLTQDATAKYNIAESQRAQVQDLIRQTGGKAGISYADTYESAVKKADTYMVKQEKEAKKEAYKDSLKQTALQLGIKTNGKNTKELEKSLKKYYKSEKEYNNKIKDLELKAKQQALAKSGTGTGSTTAVTALNSLLEKAAQMPSGGREWAASVAKTYGVNPADVAKATAQNGWEGAYRDAAKLNEQKPLSAESTKVLENAKSGSRALDTVEKLSGSLTTRVLAGLPFSPGAGEYESAKNEVLDVLTRLRTGAALTAEEEKFYKKQLPTITDNDATRKAKIERFRTLFNSISNQIQPSSSNNDPLGLGI